MTESRKIDEYGVLPAATGMDPLEVERAVNYAKVFGLEALTGVRSVTFNQPKCGNPLCTRADHQRLLRDRGAS